jgi:hypothetical protein
MRRRSLGLCQTCWRAHGKFVLATGAGPADRGPLEIRNPQSEIRNGVRQPACKPDFVPGDSQAEASFRWVATIPLAPSLLAGSRNQASGLAGYRLGRRPGSLSNLPESPADRASPSLLFGLAPRGVCPAIPVTRNAVRSYRTFSPLPRSLAGPGRYIFCGTIRESRFERDPLAVNQHAALCSPDFPPSPCGDGDRPADCLKLHYSSSVFLTAENAEARGGTQRKTSE